MIVLTNTFAQVPEGDSPTPNYIPPSQNAAALGKYGDIPVGYYTGTTNIGIPLVAHIISF